MTAVTNVDTSRRQQALAQHVDELRTALYEQRALRAQQLSDLSLRSGGVSLGPSADEVDDVIGDGAARALKEIDAAITRIEDGTYGACEKCSGEIAVERLEVLPMTPLCMRCASLRDQRAR